MRTVLAVVLLSARVASAASLVWDADPSTAGAQDGGGAWNGTNTNWWDGAANTNWTSATPDSATLGNLAGAAGTVTLSGTQTVDVLTLNAPGSGTYTLSGGQLALAATATVNANVDATIASVVGGTAGLTKNGAGALTLTGTNVFTGPIALNNGSLVFASPAAFTHASVLSGTGRLVQAGAGALTLGASNTFSGSVLITNTATLRLTNSAALGAVLQVRMNPTGNTATLELNGRVTVTGVTLAMNASSTGSTRSTLLSNGGSNRWAGPIVLDGSGTAQFTATSGLLVLEGNTTESGVFSGTYFIRGVSSGLVFGVLNIPNGTVNKTDPGVWTIASTGHTWKNTQVSVGTLRMGAANAMPPVELTMGQGDASGATLDLNGLSQTVTGLVLSSSGGTKSITSPTAATLTVSNGTAYSYGGVIAGALSVVKRAAGQLTLTVGNTFTGAVTVTDGSLRGTAVGAFGGASTNRSLVIGNGGTLDFAVSGMFGGHPSTAIPTLTINSGGVALHSFTPANSPLFNVTLNGGTMTSTGGNNIWGAWNINGVITATATSLITTAGSTNGQVMLASGTGVSNTIVNVVGAGDLLVVDTALINGRDTLSPFNAHATRLTKIGVGRLQLHGTNTYSAGTFVSNGVVALGAAGFIEQSTPILVSAGATLDVAARGGWTLVSSQLLGGAGVVTGDVISLSGAQLQPGAVGGAGALTIAGRLAMQAGAVAVLDLVAGTTDVIHVVGDLDPSSGVVRVNNQLVPPANSTNTIFTYTGTLPTAFDTAVQKTLTTRDAYTLDQVGTPNEIRLVTTLNAGQTLAWNPGFSANWDLATSNWADFATYSITDRFYEVDTVVFDNRGAASNVVTVVGAVKPGGVSVNSSSNYTFTGVGTITNPTFATSALVKAGSGTLTMGVTNTWSGDLQVGAGTLALGAPNVLPDGAGKGNAVINGALELAGFPETVNELAGSGVVTNSGALATFTINNAQSTGAFAGVIAGLVNFTKTGTGSLYLAAQQTYAGTTTIIGVSAPGTSAAARIVIGTHNALPPSTVLLRNNANFWLNGYTQELAGLVSVNSHSVYNGATNKGTLILNVSTSPAIGYLADGATGAMATLDVVLMSRSGTNTFALDTASDYVGDTTVNTNCRASVNGANALGLGAATITLNEGQIYGVVAAAAFATNKVFVLGATGGTLQGGGGTGIQGLTINGRITGAGPLLFNRDTGIVALGNTNNDYTGDTIIGVFGPLAFTGTATRLKLTAGEVIPNGAGKGSVTLIATNFGQLDLNGQTETINGLAGNGRVLNLAGSGLLRVGDNDTSSTFAGQLEFNVALTKIGTGTLTMTGNSTNTGQITASAGTLALTGSGSFSNAALVLVQAAGLLDVSARPGFAVAGGQILFGRGTITGDVAALPGAQIRPAGFNSVHTLTFRNSLGLNAGSTNWFDLTATLGVGGGTNDLVAVDGLLEPSNSVINVNPLQPLANGTYTLFTYTGTKATTFNTNVLGNATRKTWTMDETTPGQANLLVSGGYGSLVWRPGLNANWNLAVSSNWYDGAATTVFYTADTVLFDDSGAYSNVVTIAGALLPSAVIVDASSNYTWQGAGSISGTTTVVKAGSGVLAVRTTNDFSRGTMVSNGTLAVFQNNTLGSGTVTVEAPGIVRIGTAGITIGSPFAGTGSLNADTLGTGTTTLTLTNAASTFVGTINVGPAAAGGGKVSLAGGVGAGAAVNVSNNATLYLSSGSNQVGALRLLGGDTGESIGQLRLELNSTWSGPVTLAGDIGPAADGFVGNNTAGNFGFVVGAIGEAGGPRELSKVGAGTIRVSGTNTYSGGTRITAGVLDVPTISDVGPSGVGTGRLLFVGGTLRYSGTADTTTSRPVTNAGAATWNITNAARLTLTGPMSGAGSIAKSGAGTMVWASNSVFTTSAYAVDKGTLILDGCSYTSTAVALSDQIGNAAGDQALVVLTNDVQYVKTEHLWVGNLGNATGLLRVAGGRVAIGGGIRPGVAAGSVGAVYHLGGSLSAAGDSAVGYNVAGAYGYYGLHGGTFSNGNWMQVGRQGWGTMQVDGGTWELTSAANGIIAGNSPATGVLHIAGGVVRAAGRLGIGWAGTGRGEVTLDAGADVTIGNTGVQFNQAGTTFGALNLNGGALTTSNVYKQVAGGYSVLNFNGGTLRARGSQVLMGPGTPAAGALDAAYVHAGGAVIDSSNLTVTISQNLLAPPGGGVTALPWGGSMAGYVGAPIVAIRGGDGTGATAVALFDQVSGTVTGLLVTSPGVGYSVAPNVTLLGGGASATNLGDATIGTNSSGGLTKQGAGMLILSGVNNYTGLTTVAAGRLLVSGLHNGGAVTVQTLAALGGTGVVNAVVAMAPGATVQPGSTTQGVSLSVSSVVFAGGSVLMPLYGSGTGGALRVTATNGLTLPSGAEVVTALVVNATLPPGTYTVLDYEGAIQGGAATNLILGAMPFHTVGYLTNNLANTSIDLVVTGVGSPIRWMGHSDASWNVGSATNWSTVVGGAPVAYLQAGIDGDNVILDDAATGTTAIIVAQPVAPNSFSITNHTLDYRLSGQPIGGTWPLVKNGAARLELLNSNNLAGAVTINAGELRVGQAGSWGPTGALLSLVGGRLTLASDTPVHAKNFLQQGSVTVALERATAGSGLTNTMGTLTFTNGNFTLAVTAGTNVTSGTASLRFNGLWSGNGRTLTAAVGAGGEMTLAAGMPGGAQTVSVVKNGGGALVISGDNGTWDGGAIVVNGGTLDLRSSNATGDSGNFRNITAFSGTTVRVAQDLITNFYSGLILSGQVAAVSDRLTPGPGTTQTLGALTFTGPYVLTAQAGVVVTSGVQGLVFGAVTLAGASVVESVDPGASVDFRLFLGAISGAGQSLTIRGSGETVIRGVLGTGAGTLTKDGSGTLILAASNTHSGVTTISNGLLLVNSASGSGAMTVDANGTLGGTGIVRSAVLQNGTISPGVGIGTLTITNQLLATASAVTRFELGGTNAPTDYDRLLVRDIHTPAGLLEVVTTNGYVPASGDAFLIISNSALGGALFGTFNTESLPALASGLGWAVQYNGTESVGLLVTGTVALATAYELWAQSITNPALRGEQEDPDGDGYANLFEYSQGSDATNAADNAKLHLARTNGQFLAAFNRVNTATDIVYEVEGAYAPTNGALWLGIATNAIGSWGSSTNVNDNDTATIHRVWVTDLELGTNRTLRLKVTRP